MRLAFPSLLATAGLAASLALAAPPPGWTPVQTLLRPADAGRFSLVLAPGAEGTATLAADPAAGVLRIDTTARLARVWDVKAAVALDQPVAKDHLLVATFQARALRSAAETGEAAFEFGFEPPKSFIKQSYTYGFFYRGNAGAAWRDFALPFVAKLDMPAGVARLDFRVGGAPQSLEIRDLRLFSYGPGRSPSEYPSVGYSYGGREPDAPWRAEAAARIARHRAPPLAVRLVDERGAPLAGARVKVEQVRSAFVFGAAVKPAYVNGARAATEDGARYREAILDHFNTVTLENELKLPVWERTEPEKPRYGPGVFAIPPDQAIDAVRWFRERGVAVRGHTLVWQRWTGLLEEARAHADPAAALDARLSRHILAMTRLFRDDIADWDVLNEPVYYDEFVKLLGPAAPARWFTLAREGAPAARLTINDFAILAKGGSDTVQHDRYEALIRDLLARGAPLGQIGFQGHFGLDLTPPERLWQILDRFAAHGVPLIVTEFDLDFSDEALQADYARDFATALYAHPAVAGIVYWGLWDPLHWKSNSVFFRADWSLKPSGRALFDLYLRDWMTRAETVTDADGWVRLPSAHLGDYELRHTGPSGAAHVTRHVHRAP